LEAAAEFVAEELLGLAYADFARLCLLRRLSAAHERRRTETEPAHIHGETNRSTQRPTSETKLRTCGRSLP
jgi:hypothetical protein